MKLKYYDRYAQQMVSLGHGLALWQPHPNSYKRVEIGDVGYMLSGHFLRLFNATIPDGDPRNARGVPEGYEPLPMDGDDPTFESLPARWPLWSSDVRVLGADIKFSAQTPGVGLGASMDAKIMTSSGSGAMLLTGDQIFAEDTSLTLNFAGYIKKHHESWLIFAKKLGRAVELEDLILVTGRHLTDDFAMLSFCEASRDAEIGLSIGIPSLGSGSASLSASSTHITSPDVNYGPRIASQSDTPEVENGPEGSRREFGGFTRCVFLRGYRVKKRLFSIKMKAAAGPHVLGSEEREREHEAQRSDDASSTTSEDLEIISDNTRTVDPTHPLLQYILTNSEASLAIVHDSDLAWLHNTASIGMIENPNIALSRFSPTIEINDGVGRIAFGGPLHSSTKASKAILQGTSRGGDEKRSGKKRPWEDAGEDAAAVGAGSDEENQNGASFEIKDAGAIRSVADQDMAIIRSKRGQGASGAGTSPDGAQKAKYPKQSRATPPRECLACGRRDTPEWRRGPDGARTLCNACGLHYAKLIRKRDKTPGSGADTSPAPIDIEMLRKSTRTADANSDHNSGPKSDGGFRDNMPEI